MAWLHFPKIGSVIQLYAGECTPSVDRENVMLKTTVECRLLVILSKTYRCTLYIF